MQTCKWKWGGEGSGCTEAWPCCPCSDGTGRGHLTRHYLQLPLCLPDPGVGVPTGGDHHTHLSRTSSEGSQLAPTPPHRPAQTAFASQNYLLHYTTEVHCCVVTMKGKLVSFEHSINFSRVQDVSIRRSL